jgi:competence protein ComEA
VIGKAGGLLERADYKRINQAQLLKDEMVIYVPKKGEKVKDLPGTAGAATTAGTTSTGSGVEKIAINSADESELQKLPGIGPAKAKAIISYREEHGPFQKVEDLLEVSGIGEKSLEKIKEQVSLE